MLAAGWSRRGRWISKASPVDRCGSLAIASVLGRELGSSGLRPRQLKAAALELGTRPGHSSPRLVATGAKLTSRVPVSILT
jgi:hypothetical protein